MRGCILEASPEAIGWQSALRLFTTRVVIKTMFVYHFVDPELRVEIIFEKEGATE